VHLPPLAPASLCRNHGTFNLRSSCIRVVPELRRAAVASAAIEQDRADGEQARGEQLACR